MRNQKCPTEVSKKIKNTMGDPQKLLDGIKSGNYGALLNL